MKASSSYTKEFGAAAAAAKTTGSSGSATLPADSSQRAARKRGRSRSAKAKGWSRGPGASAQTEPTSPKRDPQEPRRHVAHLAASKRIVFRAAEGQSCITDTDVLDTLRLWAFDRNRHRTNLSPESNSVLCSFFGYLQGRVAVNTEPALGVPRLLNLWLRSRLVRSIALEDFRWSTICINKNFAARLHRDGNNLGPSLLASFGQHSEGGDLKYYPEDDGEGNLDHTKIGEAQRVDPRANLVLFDGRRAHEIVPFVGERYSIIFFSTRDSPKMSEEARELLRDRALFRPPDCNAASLFLSPTPERRALLWPR